MRNRFNRSKFDFRGRMYANILTDGAAILTPVSVPVWPMPCTIFAFTTALLATTSKLLTIGNFIIHELIFCPPGECCTSTGIKPKILLAARENLPLLLSCLTEDKFIITYYQESPQILYLFFLFVVKYYQFLW